MAAQGTTSRETEWPVDEQVDPVLTANYRMYRLLVNAKRTPGTLFVETFPADQQRRLYDLARHEGFAVSTGPNQIDQTKIGIAVMWPAPAK